MKIVRTIAEMKRDRSSTLGLVPTLGALHEGHLSLMRAAKRDNDSVAVSIFVNPTQFGQGEDFERYPRDLERDADLAKAAGVDVLFAPSVEEMYPRRTTEILVSEITDRWDGASRPGHFTGVATVVAKLFGIIQPDVAYFGLKDLQQCLVVQRMVEDLNLPVSLKFEPTVREADGLAMSSRNQYLSESERALAPAIYVELNRIREKIGSGNVDVSMEIADSKNRLISLGFLVDYLEWVDLDTMAPIKQWAGDSALIVAAKLGKTRLIDNLRILSKNR